MDIRSEEAQYLIGQFMRGRMEPIINFEHDPVIRTGYVNLDDRQSFVWTTNNRLLRLDNPDGGSRSTLNVLAPNRTYFTDIIRLEEDEEISNERPMSREDLLPEPGLFTRIGRSAAPTLGYWVGFSIFTAAAQATLGVLTAPLFHYTHRIVRRSQMTLHDQAVRHAAHLVSTQTAGSHAHAQPSLGNPTHFSSFNDSCFDLDTCFPSPPDTYESDPNRPGISETWREGSNADRARLGAALGLSVGTAGVITYGIASDRRRRRQST